MLPLQPARTAKAAQTVSCAASKDQRTHVMLLLQDGFNRPREVGSTRPGIPPPKGERQADNLRRRRLR